MKKAIAVSEYKTVSAGVTAADAMLKAADVDIVEAATVCPGKYIVIIAGELSAVAAAAEAGKTLCAEQHIGTFTLGNPHEGLFAAIYGTTEVENLRALGVLETFDVASMLVAADNAAKTADVQLIELRLARGMCGKSYLMLTGEVAAVQAAVDRAKQTAANEGMYLDSSVIARPDSKLLGSIV
ncbi:MAG: BMC domain-containing protein [Clostridia bacterium]|jgi:microcompartment protein CcmL/EutN|nr:BMC domain-containing protein [Clostridia bacterium]